MKYLKKFATEAEVEMFDMPNVVLAEDTGNVLYNVRPKGVFIQHINGSLYTTDQWTAGGFTSDQANGVAVCDIGASFVIAKSNASTSLKWGGYGKTIADIVTSSSSATAILDYDGAGNTTKIIEQLSGYTDSQSVVGAPAAEACANFTFPNGVKGHLPSLGEWKIAYNNKYAVDSAMSLIGGTSLGSNYYWSSTQDSASNAWSPYWASGYTGSLGKGYGNYVRAFSAL